MAKHTENDFVIPALNVLFDLGAATTSEIKSSIHKYIELNNDDLSAFESRRTRKESAYRQVVGNLISHHNNFFFKYVYKNDAGSFKLNDEGYKYIKRLRESETASTNEEQSSLYIEETSKTPTLSGIDTKYVDYIMENGFEKRPPTNNLIKETIVELSNGECLYSRLTGKKHASFKQENGKKYVEAHHLIPLKARRDFFPRNLDRPSNIVCLCSECHACLHHGSQKEKEQILRVLYDHCIDALNDDQIYISFEQLLKYYS